ncbi:hypothetical protein Ade02nite_37550 [Paractinoplanes deccanensis]|uniref:HTH cro/C1-type domain-containing protein n=1 Tax=Paractinoplanes deccanensis TaxID=113561 RepID=A0ABQ3Y527_9ACTN|nr:hypothetical protein [Actinoplanes deccanensis]GID75114.1 hypothetical protein Ade02nite_37550 [Actinoplanes deccanensis]
MGAALTYTLVDAFADVPALRGPWVLLFGLLAWCAAQTMRLERNRLRVLRAERKWTQETLAERWASPVRPSTRSRRGKFDPSLLVAFGLAEVFGCRIEDVFTPTPFEILTLRNTDGQKPLRPRQKTPTPMAAPAP